MFSWLSIFGSLSSLSMALPLTFLRLSFSVLWLHTQHTFLLYIFKRITYSTRKTSTIGIDVAVAVHPGYSSHHSSCPIELDSITDYILHERRENFLWSVTTIDLMFSVCSYVRMCAYLFCVLAFSHIFVLNAYLPSTVFIIHFVFSSCLVFYSILFRLRFWHDMFGE